MKVTSENMLSKVYIKIDVISHFVNATIYLLPLTDSIATTATRGNEVEFFENCSLSNHAHHINYCNIFLPIIFYCW